jgi:hypothetical protein
MAALMLPLGPVIAFFQRRIGNYPAADVQDLFSDRKAGRATLASILRSQ